jgi:hypothetical protein
MQSRLQQFCAQLAPDQRPFPSPVGEEGWETTPEDSSQHDPAPPPDISGTSFLDPRPLFPETARFASMVAPLRPKGEDRPFKHNLHVQVAHPSAHDTPIERNRAQARREIQLRRDQHLADLEESSLAMSAATQAMTDADLRFTQASSSIQAENFALGTPRTHGGHGEDEESPPEDWDIDPPIEDLDQSPSLGVFSLPEDSVQPSHTAQPENELSPESSPSLNESVSS